MPCAGQWIIPKATGKRPLPCYGFTLTSITNDSAILFGGETTKEDTNQLFIVAFTELSVVSTFGVFIPGFIGLVLQCNKNLT